ncbi:polysaccharide biosynthesis protein [Treponema socranskii subsp. socranskii VPI DR56BR1116 = ATCC 35536]|uniref:Polysaccharide biosynthesis protein n=1 Tax=Treponema socranskii subsp. socranskii VPI DR56BR1116 = ATCC 35536 TaxID=1125725 RepID=U1FIZ5_TRESO|nr:nucleoside-diphosphate sugar epimerase/dehydratase [Treponema socranskii]ERF59713.1 polysaccharide biosynthesis protein [Treponema socranskii subsp. socranskii VPI DR56BR1116 = ATCC 35536]ERK01528.1 polysaccharide biosynthesis protein [Treponema socranskii subsp. socranskii VPI DR56BR1116 = ATCC 35536]
MNRSDKHLYIIGAGFAGISIAGDIKRKKIFGKVAAFLDDDKSLIGQEFDGIPVLGPVADIAKIIRCTDSDEAIIAIPSASVERIKEIYETLKSGGFKHIKILPSVSQIVNGTAHLVQARDIDPLDILGRTPVTISLKESLSYLRGKRVCITGAGGSIGSELSRQLLSGGAERLYLFGHGENSIYQIDRELHLLQKEGVGEKATVVPIIGDMKDKDYVDYIVSHTKCDVVFHCAAYKHVPLMEENPVAAIENNVFGTKNLLDACIAHGVRRFVLVSTDKAVSPVSVYGVSKMLCEKLVLSYADKARDGTSFMFVRFGNVLGSRGSILPLFMEQIKNGGPVTVTDKAMERYFMTIPEACSLVLRTGGVGENGSSYLLDMGQPVKITELAEQIIRFSGFEPYKDIDIVFTGARKGERAIEPLRLPEEEAQKTSYKKIMRLKNTPYAEAHLRSLLEKLHPVCFRTSGEEKKYRNKQYLVSVLSEDVPSLKAFYAEANRG